MDHDEQSHFDVRDICRRHCGAHSSFAAPVTAPFVQTILQPRPILPKILRNVIWKNPFDDSDWLAKGIYGPIESYFDRYARILYDAAIKDDDYQLLDGAVWLAQIYQFAKDLVNARIEAIEHLCDEAGLDDIAEILQVSPEDVLRGGSPRREDYTGLRGRDERENIVRRLQEQLED